MCAAVTILKYPCFTDGKNKKKLKRRLPQWAHDELKETAKKVREEHANPEGRGLQPEPQVSPIGEHNNVGMTEEACTPPNEANERTE